MIIHTGLRTDIPAFYSNWLANRLQEGYVLVRNPYNPISVTKYLLDPSVVDLICFCTKNPEPMLRYMELLRPYGQYWFVTITPYGKDIEPFVPDKGKVIESFCDLSQMTGLDSIGWRYDPVMIDGEWTEERHLHEFQEMCSRLEGYTRTCVISFVQMYSKLKRNYPELRPVPRDIQLSLTKSFVKIAGNYGMTVKLCGDSRGLEETGADCSGCMTAKIYETAIQQHLIFPPNPRNRKECACYLTADIGQYNTCGHFCRYCYANADKRAVRQFMNQHDPTSPLLIGHPGPDDIIHEAKQKSWIDPQIRLDLGEFD